jgi:putative transcriptional regulator
MDIRTLILRWLTGLWLGCGPALALAADPPSIPASHAGGALLHPDLHPQPEQGMLLIARRDMPDPRFRDSVILLVAHDAEGSMGVIINRPSRATLGDVVPDLAKLDKHSHPVYFGGPVGMQNLTFLVHQGSPPKKAVEVLGGLYFSADRSLLEELLGADKPTTELHVYLGYAGWASGQLEGELERDDWHLHKNATLTAVFSDRPAEVWRRFIEIYEPAGQLVLAP